MNIDFLEGYKSNSASPTDILLIQPMHNKMILKMFVISYELSSNQTKQRETPSYSKDFLLFESEVYELLKNKLIDHPVYQVRNIIPLIETLEFKFGTFRDKLYNDFSRQLNPPLTKNQVTNNIIENTSVMLGVIAKKRESINKVSQDTPPVYIINTSIPGTTIDIRSVIYRGIVTAKIEQLTFGKYLEQNINIFTAEEVMRYMFVILTTIAAIANVGINQNDLHLGNILMDKTFAGLGSKTKGYFMFFQEHLLWIKNEYTPFVFDFDRSAVKGTVLSKLNSLSKYGNCSNFHEKRDLVKVLCGFIRFIRELYNVNKNPEISKLYTYAEDAYNRLFKNSELKNSLLTGTISCFMQDPTGSRSIMCDEQELNNNMESWERILSWCGKRANFLMVKWSSRNTGINLTKYIQIIANANMEREIAGIPVDEYVRSNFQWVGNFNPGLYQDGSSPNDWESIKNEIISNMSI